MIMSNYLQDLKKQTLFLDPELILLMLVEFFCCLQTFFQILHSIHHQSPSSKASLKEETLMENKN